MTTTDAATADGEAAAASPLDRDRERTARVVTRRAAIGAGVVAGATLVAACGSGSSDDGEIGAAPGTALAKTADVPAGGSLVVMMNRAPYALAKKPDGTVVAHTGVCTHMRCAVEADGAQLHCPCHQSRFDALTGSVVNGPATRPLAEVTVAVEGDSVVVS